MVLAVDPLMMLNIEASVDFLWRLRKMPLMDFFDGGSFKDISCDA